MFGGGGQSASSYVPPPPALPTLPEAPPNPPMMGASMKKGKGTATSNKEFTGTVLGMAQPTNVGTKTLLGQ